MKTKMPTAFGNRQWQQYLYKFFPRLQSHFFPCDTIRGTARSITSNKEEIIILFHEWLEHLFLFLLSVGLCHFYSRTIQFFLSAFLTMKQMFRQSFFCETLFNSGMGNRTGVLNASKVIASKDSSKQI